MSNTRRAKDDSVFHQSRYASSTEFERGLSAKLVAKRVSVLDGKREKQDRELIWFLHYVSQFGGGLEALAAQLIEKYGDRFGTPMMRKIGKSGARHFDADEILKIRNELPRELRGRFPLKGESKLDLLKICDPRAYQDKRGAEIAQKLHPEVYGELPYKKNEDEKETLNHPASYPADTFFKTCLETAARTDNAGMIALERELFDLCLNPAFKLDADGPWYFAGIVDTLRDVYKAWAAAKSASTIVTSLGKNIYNVLDYTHHSRRLSLSIGIPRTGKTFSAKAWCEQRPGRARFVEVPPGNDDGGFYRALARGIGLGNFSQYNSCDLRERVESVLLAGDLVLVLDQAQLLWPQRNFREGFPMRIEWVMAMVNAGVPIGLVSTPEFFTRLTIAQKNAEKSGWDPAQFLGRVGRYNPLPTTLERDDLIKIARTVLPNATAGVLRALAVYAERSARCLGAIESIATHAQYIAAQSNRECPTAADVATAMKESVIPSDTRLKTALKRNGKASPTLHGEYPQFPTRSDIQNENDTAELSAEPVPRSLLSPALMQNS